MYEQLHPLQNVGEITYPFPNLRYVTVEVWEWEDK